jgi:hypothetical protein
MPARPGGKEFKNGETNHVDRWSDNLVAGNGNERGDCTGFGAWACAYGREWRFPAVDSSTRGKWFARLLTSAGLRTGD